MTFFLVYHGHFAVSDILNMTYLELEAFVTMLTEIKKKEKAAMEG